jgi:hypothetical protein
MKKHALAALPLALTLVGCTSLEAVKTASTSLVTASRSWNGPPKELNDACVRQSQFNPSTNCADAPEVVKHITDANSILTQYFVALGEVASDKNFTVQPGLDAAEASALKIPKINAEQTKAVSAVVKLLTGWATRAAREKAIRGLIEDGAPPATKVIDALNEHVAGDIVIVLNGEAREQEARFSDYIFGRQVPSDDMRALCPNPPAHRLSGQQFLAAAEYCRRRAVMQGKYEAIEAYKGSLASAKTTLADLNSAKSRLTDKEIVKLLYKDAKDLNDKVEGITKAYTAEGAK